MVTKISQRAVFVLNLTILIGFIYAQQTRTVINEGKGKWGDNPPVKLQYVKKIGALDAGNSKSMFKLPGDITVDKEGNIYILDAGYYKVYKFSSTGRFLLEFGKKGKRNGQFKMPVSLETLQNGNIIVGDIGKKSLEIFNTSGSIVKNISFGELINKFSLNNMDNIVLPLIAECGDFAIFALQKERLRKHKNRRDLSLLNVYDFKGNLINKIGKIVDYKDIDCNQMLNKISFCIDNDGNYIAAFSALNRIDKYSSGGRQLLRIERPLNVIVIEPKYDKRKHILRRSSISQAVGVDRNNRIWVATYTRKSRENEDFGISVKVDKDIAILTVEGNNYPAKTDLFILEVFSKDGELLGKFPIDHFVDSMKIFGNKLFIIDQMRFKVVHEFDIIE